MSEKPEFACDDCGKSFSRQGQLKRHSLTHSQDRQYRCNECGKSFLRRDVLARHEQLHESSVGPNLIQRGARACLNCAAAKARCSGESTCARCAQRSVECRYAENTILATPQRPSAQAPNEQVSYDPLRELEQYSAHSVLHPQSVNFDAQNWNTDRQSNINWLASPVNISGATSGSLDTMQWLFDDTPLWGNGHNLPFDISPLPTYSTDFAARRASDALADASTMSTESPATSTAAPSKEAGKFYVDGSESRLPHVKRRKLSSKSGPKTATPIEMNFSLNGWTGLFSGDEAKQTYQISKQVYQSFRNAYTVSCLRVMTTNVQSMIPFIDQVSSPPVSSADFASDLPPKEVFDHLLTLYMEHFQPVVPLFQPSNLPSSWYLLFAMCALGSHFGIGNVDQFIVSIHEFMRRVVHMSVGEPFSLPKNGLVAAQVKLLHTIGLLYCGDERLSEYGHDIRLLNTHFEPVWKIANQNYHDWESWRRTESARRTSYAIWLVDCMVTIHFHQKPLLGLEYADTRLPCHQKVWAATDLGQWEDCSKQHPSPPTLAEALQQLYIEKRLPQGIGDFGSVLIIHGIFHRTWEVERYHKQPLSRWSPSAEKQLGDELNTKTAVWLPSIPTFVKWRNSACDCLDILHWSANAAIGAAAGMEPPQVMHLHFARVVLLTPHKHVVSLVTYLAGESTSHSSEDAARDRQVIRRWATQDQYKARLAMIHAGVMFWHVRRFSANGFYEPSSVALAALSLWAFSAFSARQLSRATSNAHGPTGPREDGNPSRDTDSSQEEDAYDIILLDRPTDDELVQQFVRRGYTMKANMNGVGDLYGERGPERVLIEGRKLLATLNCWGTRERWIRIFDKLITVTRQERRNTVAGSS